MLIWESNKLKNFSSLAKCQREFFSASSSASSSFYLFANLLVKSGSENDFFQNKGAGMLSLLCLKGKTKELNVKKV